MYNDKIFLTPQEILEKEFKIDARGYRPQEVDKYLDMVIRDYAEFGNIIKKLSQDLKDLTNDNSKLKAEIRRLQENMEMNKDTTNDSNFSNVDLLKRISNLEKIVYGQEERNN